MMHETFSDNITFHMKSDEIVCDTMMFGFFIFREGEGLYSKV